MPYFCELTLTRHPQSPRSGVPGIDARIARTPAGGLTVSYALKGALDSLRIPQSGPARRADRLWQHTCFELFLRCAGAPAYHELNFAPSREWAAYAFTAYRKSAPLADQPLDPDVTVRISEGRLELEAVISLDRLSPALAASSLVAAVSAVVEDREGGLSYWALAHPAGKPDFHHPDAFALRLDLA